MNKRILKLFAIAVLLAAVILSGAAAAGSAGEVTVFWYQMNLDEILPAGTYTCGEFSFTIEQDSSVILGPLTEWGSELVEVPEGDYTLSGGSADLTVHVCPPYLATGTISETVLYYGESSDNSSGRVLPCSTVILVTNDAGIEQQLYFEREEGTYRCYIPGTYLALGDVSADPGTDNSGEDVPGTLFTLTTIPGNAESEGTWNVYSGMYIYPFAPESCQLIKIGEVTIMKEKSAEPAASTPFPVIGLLAGLGAVTVLLKRKQ